MTKQKTIQKLAEKFESQDRGLSYHELAELAFDYFQQTQKKEIERLKKLVGFFSKRTGEISNENVKLWMDLNFIDEDIHDREMVEFAEWIRKNYIDPPFQTTLELLTEFRESKINQ